MDVDGNVYSLYFFFPGYDKRVHLGRVRKIFDSVAPQVMRIAVVPTSGPYHPREEDEAREIPHGIIGPRGAARGAVITAVSSRIHQLSMTRRHESAAPGHSLRDGKRQRRRRRRIAHYIIRAGFPESARCSILVSRSNLHWLSSIAEDALTGQDIARIYRDQRTFTFVYMTLLGSFSRTNASKIISDAFARERTGIKIWFPIFDMTEDMTVEDKKNGIKDEKERKSIE